MTWTRRNGGYFNGQWTTRHTCDECGYAISDEWPNWRELKAIHTHNTTAPTLFEDDPYEDDGRLSEVDVKNPGAYL